MATLVDTNQATTSRMEGPVTYTPDGNNPHYVLPVHEDKTYSIKELLALVDLEHHYGPRLLQEYEKPGSNLLVEAIRKLETAVRVAVSDPKTARTLLPRTDKEYRDLINEAAHAVELKTGLEEALRKADNLGAHELLTIDELKEAANDPLRMARKTVINLLAPPGKPFNCEHTVARQVERLMIFMAQNELVQARGQAPGRA